MNHKNPNAAAIVDIAKKYFTFIVSFYFLTRSGFFAIKSFQPE